MKLVKRILTFTVCLMATSAMQAQFMDFGTDPSRFKWNQVKLPHYNLIYPQGNDSMAYYYALYLENVYPHLSKTIGKPVNMKFPVILHPASMSSNGMVSWAPRRMELIPTPAANSLSMQRFDKHLVLHESRHVFQTGKIMHGIFKPLYYIIGEQSAGVASVLVPRWFFEGDAVSTETAMSNGGRGRLPEFNMAYRAQILGTGKNYSFDKWLLGSYKNYTGDFYALGYDLASYARYRYGADIWDKTTSRFVKTVRIPWFSKAFKHFSGSSIDGLYKKTFSYLEDEWRKMSPEILSPTYLSMKPVSYTSYRYPQVLNDSVVIAVKSSLKDLNALVELTHGEEKHLIYIGNLNSRLHLRNGRVYWTEIVPDLRWSLENYSVLKSYDLETKRINTLTSKRRYLAPAIDEQGKLAAVSCSDIQGNNSVVLLDLNEEGKEVSVFSVPDNAFVKEITFGDEGKVIAVAVTGTGLDLLQLDTHTGKWTELLQTVSLNITSLIWKDGKVYFESGANGINNIYSFNPANSQVNRLTSSQFGAFDPSISSEDGRLFYADYQPDGYRIASLPVDSLLNEKVDFSKPFVTPFVKTLTAQEEFNLDSARLDSIDFKPERYRKLPHTFKIHSWAPFYYDVTEAMNTSADDLSTIVKPGVTVLSQNTLGTSVMQAGWYIEDGYNHGKFSYTYKGWFPVLDLVADYGAKAFDMTWVKNDKGMEGISGRYVQRNRLEAEARLYLPFNLTGRQYIRGIQPSVTYYFTNNKYQQYESRKYSNFQYILPELRFYGYRKMAVRDILPRFGYQARLQYLKSPFNSENYGSLYAARLTTYLPGIMRNHSLMLRGGYQYQDLDNKYLYLPKQLIDSPRGYNYIYQTQQQWMFKADYAFPVFYPDWNIGSWIYFKRLRANLFYDMNQNQASKKSGWITQSSYGAELNVDWNVFRLNYPLTTGVRLVQPIDYGKFQAEVLFSVSF